MKYMYFFLLTIFSAVIVLAVPEQNCHRSAASFNISDFAPVTVQYVQFAFEITSIDESPSGYCAIQNISYGDPKSQTDDLLYTDMGGGLTFNNSYDDYLCDTNLGVRRANLTYSATQELLRAADDGLVNWSVGVWLVDEKSGLLDIDNEELIVGYDSPESHLEIEYQNPTPVNGSMNQNNCSFDVNISVIDDDLALFDFQLEVKPYNYGVLSYGGFATIYNFENLSALSETQTLVKDISTDSENNDGVVTGANVNETDCMFGKCRMFDGNDKVVPASPNPGHWHDAYDKVTYAMWVHPWDITLNGSGQTVFEEGGSYSGTAVYINNSKVTWCLQNANDLDKLTIDYPNDGKGHYLQFKFVNSNMTVFIDGSIKGSLATSFASITSHGSDPTIGYGSGVTGCDQSNGYFKGNIDEFRRHQSSRGEQYLNMTSHMLITKLNESLWNFYGWNFTGYWNWTDDWNIFDEDTWYYYNASVTDTSSRNNKTETRYWECSLGWCQGNLKYQGNWMLNISNDDLILCENEFPVGHNLSLGNHTIRLHNSTANIHKE